MAQQARRAETGRRREVDMIMAKLGAMPRILCWKCRQLTPFELDRCQHCGSAFAGSTGGAYGNPRAIVSRAVPVSREGPRPSKRTLSQVFEDLRRVHDVSARAKSRPRERDLSVHLYQCPACGRFVSEEATDCACGVRFAPTVASTYACPECGSHVPGDDAACPVCGVAFEPTSGVELIVYACPRCGTRVASDQARCACGAWFEE